MLTALIWIKNIAILILCVFFLIIGINTLVGSYQLKNPVEFVMYFFSASLIILVCLAGFVYLFFWLFNKNNEKETTDDRTK